MLSKLMKNVQQLLQKLLLEYNSTYMLQKQRYAND
jgi:hypothetical protein